MSRQEILEKAIQKAIDGGWEGKKPYDHIWHTDEGDAKKYAAHLITLGYVERIIFSPDFAKALWGEEYVMSREEIKAAGYSGVGTMIDLVRGAGWRHHLREMVIADDPIEYLGEHL